MWTILYKRVYIHGYCDKDECGANILEKFKTFKSLRVAKIAITKASRK
jgi:hypothetical protein